jgi:hypothetical protein
MSSHLVVDGSNIATEGRTQPSLAQLDEAVRSFLDERPHDHFIVVVDATFEHRIDASEKRMYDEAEVAGELITPPAGTIGRGDKFLLAIAERTNATVFSNDSFQEFHAEYEWLFDEGRLVGGKPVPGVGWIFTVRTPVRGLKSRMATRATTRKRTRTASGAAAKKAAKASPRSAVVESGPPTAGDAVTRSPRSRRRAPGEPINPPLPFIEFISEHQLGSKVKGEVIEFTSHGGYVRVGDVRCYVGLRFLGDPPPRSAREVLTRGEVREFVVQHLDASRRGIDLALPGLEQLPTSQEAVPDPPARRPATRRRATSRPKSADEPVTAEVSIVGTEAADQASVVTEASPTQSEAILPKQTVKKRAAKKSTAASKATKRSTAAKKSAAKRTNTAKKATTKRPAAKKATAKKKAPARKTTAAAKKTKKATAKKSSARKTTAAKKKKKAPAKKKASARKTGARKTSSSPKAAATRRRATQRAAVTKAVKATKQAAAAIRQVGVQTVRG